MSRLGILFGTCLFVTRVAAQDVDVQVATQEPPYYVGEPVVIQFAVEGFDEQPEPTCRMEESIEGLRGQMAGANPSVFSQIVQRNGRVFRSKAITFRINYVVTADRSGEYTIGPFVLKQGNKEARVQPLNMSFNDVPSDPNMRVRLILPEGPFYPDQRVPVGVEWWYAGDFDDVVKLRIYSQLFDSFRFAPDEQDRRDSTARLPIDTQGGRLPLSAQVREEDHEGKRFTVVAATRTLIPDRVGEFQVPPITATIRKATAWTRQRSPFDDGFFGGSAFGNLLERRRQPAKVELGRATGEAQTVVVQPYPADGRPESFAGAVGAGFSIDVSADRTVVRVDDPIALTISLRGDGNMENAGLPALSADGGMDPERFRLPEGDVAGAMLDGLKQFRVSVRVMDETVAEIPALAYSWFDPDRQSYQTTKAKPIALHVMPANVISASDVVSRGEHSDRETDGLRNGADSSTNDDSGKIALGSSSNSAFSLTGADLAIEPDVDILMRDASRNWIRLGVHVAIYVVSLLLIGLAVLDRKRIDIDPVVAKRRRTSRQQIHRIEAAARLPAQRAAEEIAAAMRALVAEFPDGDREEALDVIAQCDAVAYMPEGSSKKTLDSDLIPRAKAVAHAFQLQNLAEERGKNHHGR